MIGYNKDELFKKAKEVSKESNLFFIEDVVAMLGIAKPTFYEKFPIDSYEMNEIKSILNENRIHLKVSMRKRWYESDAPALQMALMKLLSTDEELRKLSMSHTDVTSGGKELINIINLGSGEKPE